MKSSDVPMMTLRRAVQWCGGIDALGDRLNVNSADLEKWIAGDKEVPHPVFVAAVGLILEASATRPPHKTPDSNEGGRRGPRH